MYVEKLWPNEKLILRYLHDVGGQASVETLVQALGLSLKALQKAAYWLRRKRLVLVLLSSGNTKIVLTKRGYAVCREIFKRVAHEGEEDFDDLPF